MTGPNSTTLAGTINALGINFFITNPNGINIAQTANILSKSFIASTLGISTDFTNSNGNYVFEQGPKPGKITNQGKIVADNIALIANSINNSGVIQATAGSVNLASGSKATVSFDQQGLIQVEVNQATTQKVLNADGSIVNDAIANSVTIQAHQVYMTVKTAQGIFQNAVNQTGMVNASQMVNDNGVIKIMAHGADVISAGTMTAGQGGTIDVETDKSIKSRAIMKRLAGQSPLQLKRTSALQAQLQL